MKKIYTIFLFFSFIIISISCSTIDVAVSKKENLKSKITKIAIFPFDINDAKWGDELSDSISHHFFKNGKIDIVERDALEKIFKEQNLSMSGLIDQNKALKIGKMTGADLIILGRGSALQIKDNEGNTIPNLIDTFSLKSINVETGAILLTVRKESGRDWDAEYRAKWVLSFGLIWDRRDVLIQSSNYDEIAEKIVDKILDAIKDIES
jgi:hypothetical protein